MARRCDGHGRPPPDCQRDRQTTKGLLPNDVERTPQRWVFVHIPKAAGASFMIDARHFLTRRDTITGSEEKGAFSRTTLRKLENGGMRAILLRRPLQLVYSQFLYCKNVLKGKVKDFPGHGQSEAWAGVKEWSKGATKVTAERGPFWKCYDPRNVQFRFVVGEGSALNKQGRVVQSFCWKTLPESSTVSLGLLDLWNCIGRAYVCSAGAPRSKCRPTAAAAPRGLCSARNFRPLRPHTARPTTHHWIKCLHRSKRRSRSSWSGTSCSTSTVYLSSSEP